MKQVSVLTSTQASYNWKLLTPAPDLNLYLMSEFKELWPLNLMMPKKASHMTEVKTGVPGVYQIVQPTSYDRLLWNRSLWSSGHVRRLMIERSRVRIPARDTRWTIFDICMCFCLKRSKMKEKRILERPLG